MMSSFNDVKLTHFFFLQEIRKKIFLTYIKNYLYIVLETLVKAMKLQRMVSHYFQIYVMIMGVHGSFELCFVSIFILLDNKIIYYNLHCLDFLLDRIYSEETLILRIRLFEEYDLSVLCFLTFFILYEILSN